MRRTVLAITLALLFTAVPAAADDHQLPDKAKTPGKPLLTVPDQKAAACLTQLMGDTVAVGEAISLTMICTPNYSRCIRNVSEDEKKAVYDAYGIPGGEHHGYCDVTQGCEVDHLISIEIGGSNEQTNLWPQPYSGLQWNAHVKDRLERFYRDQVCSGKILLTTAQREIADDWVAAYKKRIGPEPESEQ
jgi:hypothetical protein